MQNEPFSIINNRVPGQECTPEEGDIAYGAPHVYFRRFFTRCLSVFLLLSLVFAFSGCGAREEAALLIAEVPLEKQVFLYFYDTVRTHPTDYGLVRNSPHKLVANQAVDLCAQYMTVNTRFAQENASLTIEQKNTLSSDINMLWRLYGAYYQEIGLAKQTLTKVETTNAYRERLFLDLYDSGGEHAVPEAQIQQYFNENYLVFRVINGYLSETDENNKTIPLAKKDADKLRNEFKEMAQNLRDGGNIDDVNSAFLGMQAGEVPLTVLRKGSKSYSDAFFQDVQKLKTEEPAVLEYADEGYLFLVVKEKVDFEKSEQYQSNRIDCLKGLKEAEFLQELCEQANTYSVRRNESVISQTATLPKPMANK